MSNILAYFLSIFEKSVDFFAPNTDWLIPSPMLSIIWGLWDWEYGTIRISTYNFTINFVRSAADTAVLGDFHNLDY